MRDKLGDTIMLIYNDNATEIFLQNLYQLYVDRDVDEIKNYNQFAKAFDNVLTDLNQSYSDLILLDFY